MSMATVSVLVPVWNNARFLGEALQSALAQTRPPDEIIVVDDGSEDDSAAVAESLGVRVIREPHRGVAATRNVAWRAARGELIAWLDSDDLWTPDKIAVQAGYMEAHPEAAITFTHQRVLFESETKRPFWVTDPMMAGESPAFGTCSMMMRSALRERFGEFDEARVIGEDLHWTMRAEAGGVPYVVLPETLLVRRVHANNVTTIEGSRSAGNVFEMLRDRIRRRRDGV